MNEYLTKSEVPSTQPVLVTSKEEDPQISHISEDGNSLKRLKQQTKQEDENSTWAASAQSLAATIVVALYIVTFLLQTFQIPTPSMLNTLLVGDFLLVDKVMYGSEARNPVLPYRTIERNAIIVFFWPVDPRQRFVKRVIALPGDRIRLQSGKVFVNGVQQQEPFAFYQQSGLERYRSFRDNFPTGGPMDSQVTAAWAADMKKLIRNGELLVPEGNYFAMGDNRNDSLDSRYWGLVPREAIIGRPLLIYWSLRGWSDGSNKAMALSDGQNQDDKISGTDSIGARLKHMVRWERTLHLVP